MATAAAHLYTTAEIRNSCRPSVTTAVLIASDILAITMAWVVSLSGRLYFGAVVDLHLYLRLSPILLAFIAAFAIVNLYPGSGISPVEELRLLIRASTVVYINLVVLTF